jgi:hypothetical protein
MRPVERLSTWYGDMLAAWDRLLYVEGEEAAYEHWVDRVFAWVFPTGIMVLFYAAFIGFICWILILVFAAMSGNLGT